MNLHRMLAIGAVAAVAVAGGPSAARADDPASCPGYDLTATALTGAAAGSTASVRSVAAAPVRAVAVRS